MRIKCMNWIDYLGWDNLFNSIIDSRKVSGPILLEGINQFTVKVLSKQNNQPHNFSLSGYTVYDTIYKFNVTESPFGIPPTHFSVTSTILNHNNVLNLPHAIKPAPANSVHNMMLIWSKDKDNIIPHREDGFPAIIQMWDFNRYAKDGYLHRNANNGGAISCKTIQATWMVNGKKSRSNGPCIIAIDKYDEYWQDGIYKGYRIGDIIFDFIVENKIVHCNVISDQYTISVTDVSNIGISSVPSIMVPVNYGIDVLKNSFFNNSLDEMSYLLNLI